MTDSPQQGHSPVLEVGAVAQSGWHLTICRLLLQQLYHVLSCAAGNFNAAGQLGAGPIGFNNDDMAVRLQQQTMQMQQVLCSVLGLPQPPACLQSAPCVQLLLKEF